MGELEQAPREALSKIDFSKLTEIEKKQAWTAISDQIVPIDKANQAALLDMVPVEGWFPISRYGRDGANAAFLIVQHSEPALWRRFLPVIEEMVARGEAEAPAYALMYDRLALSEHRAQRYGSQMECRNGRFAPVEPLEAPQELDKRRTAIGLKPFADYLKLFESDRC